MQSNDIGYVLNMLFKEEYKIDNGKIVAKLYGGPDGDCDILWVKNQTSEIAINTDNFRICNKAICSVCNGNLDIIDTETLESIRLASSLGTCYSLKYINDEIIIFVFSNDILVVNANNKELTYKEHIEDFIKIPPYGSKTRYRAADGWEKHPSLFMDAYEYGSCAILVSNRGKGKFIKLFTNVIGVNKDKSDTADMHIYTDDAEYFVRGRELYTCEEWLKLFNIEAVLPIKYESGTPCYPVRFSRGRKGTLSSDYTRVYVGNQRIPSAEYSDNGIIASLRS